jgi:hypothetical protein
MEMALYQERLASKFDGAIGYKLSLAMVGQCSTLVKCHFGLYFFIFFGYFTKMCSAKFPSFTLKASLKTAYHKTQ